MHIDFATLPGNLTPSNEDFIGATSNGVVLVDGAGVRPPYPGCSHGVAWYARQLCGQLLAGLDSETDLTSLLASAIAGTASLHPTCDLSDPSAPFGAVAIVRFSDAGAEYLALSDAVILLLGDTVQVIRDEREFAFANPHKARLAALEPGTAAYDEARNAAIATMRGNRNQPDGYWVASSDPVAAAHAITGFAEGVRSAVVLSNGASRLVDRFGLATWSELVSLVSTEGAAELLNRVRAAEAGGEADDATAAVVTWSPTVGHDAA